MSQRCLFEVSRKLQGCFKEVLRVFTGSFEGVSRKFQECFKKFLRAFKKTSKGVSREFSVCFRGI